MRNRLTRWFAILLGVLLLVWFIVASEKLEERTLLLQPPLEEVTFRTFTLLPLVTKPTQRIEIRVAKEYDVTSLLDFGVFGGLQPGRSDEEIEVALGKPLLRRVDDLGGSWVRYPTSFGYVEAGCEGPASGGPTDSKSKTPRCRRRLRAFTDRPLSTILREPLLAQVHAGEQMTRKAGRREVVVIDAGKGPVLEVVVSEDRFRMLELYLPIERNPQRATKE